MLKRAVLERVVLERVILENDTSYIKAPEMTSDGDGSCPIEKVRNQADKKFYHRRSWGRAGGMTLPKRNKRPQAKCPPTCEMSVMW